MKKLFHKLHLWLGLASGLFVFVIALTGALYAFQEEISSLNSYHHVEVRNADFIAPSRLKQVAESRLPGKKMNSIAYHGPEKPVEAMFYGYSPTYYYIVFLNPYNGEVLKVKDMSKDFFRIVMQGHFYLWLPPAIGQPLVVASTIVFLLVLITGVVIWFPKTVSKIKNRLLIQWKKGVAAYKVNYDLHVVGGWYVTIFGLIFALTGLVWGLPPYADGVHKLVGGTKSLQYGVTLPKSLPKDGLPPDQALDEIWSQMLGEYPDAGSISISPSQDSTSAITANITQADGLYWKTDYRYFAPRSLSEIKSDNIYGRFADADGADKLLRMNYEIHTGAILGLPGKILAFLASLFIASLPVTGAVIWWRKRRKTNWVVRKV
jgi:uncharacterized iron-regulated membrane protein